MNSTIQKKFLRGNLAFLFIVGALMGAIGKNATFNTLRIGYQDPQTVLPVEETLYDIDAAEQRVAAKAAALMEAQVAHGEEVVPGAEEEN